jgi:hypothetical protein
MQENKLMEMINLFFNGELQKSEEVKLFSNLANNQEARDYFKNLSLIRSIVDKSAEDFPGELEERILRSVGSRTSQRKKIFSDIKIFQTLSYAAAVLLIFLAGYLFSKVTSYQETVDNLSKQVAMQSKTIQMLYNSSPSVEVIGALENKIIVKPKI